MISYEESSSFLLRCRNEGDSYRTQRKLEKNNLLSDIFSLSDFFTEMIKPRYEILTLEQEEFRFYHE